MNGDGEGLAWTATGMCGGLLQEEGVLQSHLLKETPLKEEAAVL